MKEIVQPLDMYDTAPTVDNSLNFNLSGYDRAKYYSRLAKAYDWSNDSLKSIRYPVHISPAAGMMSSVADLAKYSNAIDERKFLEEETWETMFTPVKSRRGRILRYGLGWFVTYKHGVKMIWHTGWWQGVSALFLKVPDHDLTFILLANSQDASRPFYHFLNPLKRNLARNISGSAFARAFFKHFIFWPKYHRYRMSLNFDYKSSI
jgi:CubicO group peptidase (beta-lactamase class C family)